MDATPSGSQDKQVTRLDVLREARKQAELLGAVESGGNYFERQNGERRTVAPLDLITGKVQPAELCGVCIAGACILAEVLLGVGVVNDPYGFADWCEECEESAVQVLGDEAQTYECEELVTPITERGTPYVLAVIDEMLRRETERVAA